MSMVFHIMHCTVCRRKYRNKERMPGIYQACGLESGATNVLIGTDGLVRSNSFSTDTVVDRYNAREKQRDDLNHKMQAFRST